MQTFVPPAKGLGLLVHDVGRLLRRKIDQRAQALGLTSAQWRVLAAVARTELLNQEPLNQAGLADQLEIEPITLSRLVDRMESAKLIERR
ncbi:MAG TPA: helix-turn-helix domain-containing protein, partial [Methyloceanibacter sp.]|nr:helix-turn-helix domain-containing protein [Methyloceanibacter sp.]